MSDYLVFSHYVVHFGRSSFIRLLYPGPQIKKLGDDFRKKDRGPGDGVRLVLIHVHACSVHVLYYVHTTRTILYRYDRGPRKVNAALGQIELFLRRQDVVTK